MGAMPRRRQRATSANEASPRRPRIAVNEVVVGGLALDREQAHYLSRVLRLGAGDIATLFDARGREAEATITQLTREGAAAEVVTVRTRPTLACSLTVALATPKGERADWAIEKLTEVGVDRILWLVTERSVMKPDPVGARTERWTRLARAAASQSERVGWPQIQGPIPFDQFLTLDSEHRLIADRSGEPLESWVPHTHPRSALLGIGPEGGFTTAELEASARAGFVPVSLSPNILRVETAAIIGAAMILGHGGGDS